MSRHSLPAHEKIRHDILSAGQTGGLIVREITEITHFELDPFFGGVYELSGYRDGTSVIDDVFKSRKTVVVRKQSSV